MKNLREAIGLGLTIGSLLLSTGCEVDEGRIIRKNYFPQHSYIQKFYNAGFWTASFSPTCKLLVAPESFVLTVEEPNLKLQRRFYVRRENFEKLNIGDNFVFDDRNAKRAPTIGHNMDYRATSEYTIKGPATLEEIAKYGTLEDKVECPIAVKR